MKSVTRSRHTATVEGRTRNAAVVENTWDPEARTIEVMFSSGASARAYDWRLGGAFEETLEVTDAACDLTRLNAGANVLDDHNAWAGTRGILGVILKAWIRSGKAYAKIQFTERDEWDGVIKDIATGITRNFSVGYWVTKYRDVSEKDSDVKRYHAIEWEPYEISPTCVPAEVGAGTRSGAPDEKSKERFEIPVVTSDDTDNPEDMRTRNFGTGVAPAAPANNNAAPEGNAPQAPAAAPASSPEPSPQQRTAAPSAPAAAPVPAGQPLDVATLLAQGAEQERSRAAAIREHCGALRLPDGEIRSLVELGLPLSEITEQVAAAFTRSNPVDQTEINPTIAVGEESRDKRRAAAVAGLVARMGGSVPDVEVGEFRNRSVQDVVRLMEHGAGNDGLRMTTAQVQTRAFHTAGDLPFLLEEAGRRILLDRYQVAASSWEQWCRQVDLRDFRQHDRMRLGDAPQMEEVPDGAKITYGTVGESKEPMRLATYGKGIAFGRQALINDDLGAFTDLIQMQATRVADLVSLMAYAELTGGTVNGKGLYDNSHNNKTTGILSVENLGKARAVLGKQKTMGGRKGEGAMPMNLRGKYLIVPVSLGHLAEVLTTNVAPGNAGEVNPYAGRLTVIEEARLDDASELQWYILADSMAANTVDVGWLEGNRGPQFGQMECMESRGLKWHCWADVTAKAIDYRGVIRSSGA